MDRFKDQLKRQFNFLINSCKIFDNGDWEEAIRIATCIRVLIHDTSKSTSLLKHLNARNIKLFNTSPEIPNGENGYEPFHAFTMGIIDFGNQIFGYLPNLEDFKPSSSVVLPIEEWWNQIVWILSPECKLTRKRIILSAANQDGGAHVDAKLNSDYEDLSQYNFGTLTCKTEGKRISMDVDKLHLITIRTIANEILKSPDFLSLLKLLAI